MGLPVRTADRLGHDGADRGHLSRGFLWWGVMARHDGGMQLTPLRVPKIGAFLKVRISPNVIPIYRWRRS